MKRTVFHLAAVLLTLALLWPALRTAASAGQGKLPRHLAALDPFAIKPGRLVYERYCLFCHGDTGKGDGLNAYALPMQPADLFSGDHRASEEERYRIVLKGGAATGRSLAMPAFDKTLSAQEQEVLFAWMQGKR